jgi:hypothetical protein
MDSEEKWFEVGIGFLNYGNPIQELKMAISTSEDVKHLMLDMIQPQPIKQKGK